MCGPWLRPLLSLCVDCKRVISVVRAVFQFDCQFHKMAEALGVASGVVAVLGMSEKILCACYQYCRAARNAKTDILEVINAVSSLKNILSDLQRLFENRTARFMDFD